jgi:hypothetical protein
MTTSPYDDRVELPPEHRGWLVVSLSDRNSHILPVDDGWYHLPDDCDCGPSYDLVQHEAAPDSWVVVHHSLDGREQYEP